MLDAARDLIIDVGPRAVGMRDITKRSGAPSGSLYHRFNSRDELLARVWLRAVRRFQAGFMEALEIEDPFEAVAAGARWGVEFALAAPGDAQLLLNFGRSDLLDREPRGAIVKELDEVNLPVERAVTALAVRAYGDKSRRSIERTTYAVIDLPLAVVRRHLIAGTLGEGAAKTLEAAVRALLINEDKEP
jgi:AcrR family transcriptional regulator